MASSNYRLSEIDAADDADYADRVAVGGWPPMYHPHYCCCSSVYSDCNDLYYPFDSAHLDDDDHQLTDYYAPYNWIYIRVCVGSGADDDDQMVLAVGGGGGVVDAGCANDDSMMRATMVVNSTDV